MRPREGQMEAGVICIQQKRAQREGMTNDQNVRRREMATVIEEMDIEVR